ncbi:MAG: HAD family phosphatase [Oscillospiraceae bacterium]|nr:HAD family phosphatase [Oscillospiraceae bacterium]
MERFAIFSDLDGTLLNDDKTISERNLRTIERAVKAGHWFIPCTGRYFGGMPPLIRSLPFCRYYVCMNGAEIYDKLEQRAIRREEIPIDRALEIWDIMDNYDGIYDCFVENRAFMDRTMKRNCDFYVREPAFNKMVHELRQAVPDFKSYIKKRYKSIQKTQIFFADPAERAKCAEALARLLPDCSVTSSVSINIEVNSLDANKGEAVRFMCGYLDLPVENSIAFGDSTNDLSMLSAAGIGVAMENAVPEAKRRADMVTATNNSAGVAKALEKILAI